MFTKVLKWLPVFATATMLYATSDVSTPDLADANSSIAQQQTGGQQMAQPNCAPAPQPCQKPCAPPPPPCPKPCAPPPPPCPPKPCAPPPCKPCCVPAKLCPLPVCEPPCYDPCCGPMTYYNHNINPSARCTDDNNGVTLVADFLWWTADEADLPYAFVNTGNTVGVQEGYIANVKYKWDPGFRVGLGWDTAYDGWDLFVDWTWYKNSSKSSVSEALDPAGVGPMGVHAPILSFGTAGRIPGVKVDPIFDSASAKWRLLYNMFDLELGRSYYISCGLALRPYIGAKGGWINRKLILNFVNTEPPSVVPGNDIISHVVQKVNFWGVGPRMGLNGDWKVGAGFEVFGNASGALLYGKTFKNYETVTLTTITPPPTSTIVSNISNKKHDWRVVPTAQLIVGLGWGDCFNCGKLYFGVRAGWEVNYYWNLPAYTFIDGNQAVYSFARNLDLAGLTVDFRIDF